MYLMIWFPEFKPKYIIKYVCLCGDRGEVFKGNKLSEYLIKASIAED